MSKVGVDGGDVLKKLWEEKKLKKKKENVKMAGRTIEQGKIELLVVVSALD